MPRHLLIVSREDPDLHAYVAERFARDSTIEVVLDRRVQQRRRLQRAVALERRQGERRFRTEVDEDLRLRSHVVVTLALEPETVIEALRWIEAGHIHLATAGDALIAHARLAQEARVSKQEADQLRAEVVGLRSEVEQYRQEWQTLSTMLTHMTSLMNDLYRAASRVTALMRPPE